MDVSAGARLRVVGPDGGRVSRFELGCEEAGHSIDGAGCVDAVGEDTVFIVSDDVLAQTWHFRPCVSFATRPDFFLFFDGVFALV